MKTNLKLAHPPKTPELLAQAWLDAKAEENSARAKRIEIEEELLAILPCREEGSQTSKLENGMRVVTEGRMTRSIDAKALQDDWSGLPAIIQGAFHWKPDLKITCFKSLEDDHKALIAKYVTTKPAKAGVKVEV
jgi:hypothetical protein